ncbi:hypothetical protein GCM10007881_51320 [Mesorhizobium huakuii]|nr:hypothetical protein GCM10007881_51320 [Mesorhizobium huakuii]
MDPVSISSLQTFAIYTIRGFVNESSTMFDDPAPEWMLAKVVPALGMDMHQNHRF